MGSRTRKRFSVLYFILKGYGLVSFVENTVIVDKKSVCVLYKPVFDNFQYLWAQALNRQQLFVGEYYRSSILGFKKDISFSL